MNKNKRNPSETKQANKNCGNGCNKNKSSDSANHERREHHDAHEE